MPPTLDPTQTPQPQAQAPQGVFGKIGLVLPGIANRLAAAFGNYGPLHEEQRQQQLGMQKQLQDSTLQDQAQQRTQRQQLIDNFETPTQRDTRALALKRAETPTTYRTDEGETGIAEADLSGKYSPRIVNVPNPELRTAQMDQQRTSDFNKNFPGGQVATPAPPPLPPTIPRPATQPQQFGFHLTGLDDNGNSIVTGYGKNMQPIGSAPAPQNPNAPIIPGVGKLNPLDSGAAGGLPPNPKDFPQGKHDPAFLQAYSQFIQKASGAKQSNAIEVAKQRAIAMGENRPINALGPDNTDIVSTLARESQRSPGQDVQSGNQSGAKNVAGSRATFAEMDRNLANSTKSIDDAFAVHGGESLGDWTHRAALAATLNPSKANSGLISEIPGLSVAKGALEGLAQNQLDPREQALADVSRNMRQGAASLRNVLSTAGVTDARVETLESELITEGDIMAGSKQHMHDKFNRFINIYNDIKNSYPQLLGGSAGQSRSVLTPRPTAAPKPTGPIPLPPTSPSGSKVIRYDASGNRIQ